MTPTEILNRIPPKVGPDAARYWLAGSGVRQSRPFYLRWFLPKVLGDSMTAWWAVWGMSWPLLAAAMFAWRLAAGDGWQVAAAAAGLLIGLPGILGPEKSIPIQVDLPATALMVTGFALFEVGHPATIAAGVAVTALAATMRETVPIWAALTLWTLWPLMALIAPLMAWLIIKPAETDPLGAKFQDIADHPIRAALASHAGQWRDGWLMVASWGVCLAALYAPDWRIVAILVVAYMQLLIATDTVRLLQHAAGPAMAAAASVVIPVEWLLLAVVVHVVWFRVPERI